MKQYKKLLVGLDFSNADRSILGYVKFVNELIEPEEIHFLNVQENIEVPENVLEEFPQLRNDIKKSFVQEMQKEVLDHQISNTKTVFDMVSGPIIEETLNYASSHDIDLLVIGRKPSLNGTGFNPERLAREFKTDSILVPVSAEPKLDKVMVMIDFSKHSKETLEAAIKNAREDSYKVVAHHLFEVPIGFDKTGKSFKEFAEIMKANAQKEYDKFIEGVDLTDVEVEPVFTCSNDKEFSEVVMEVGKETGVDMLMVAARGRTKAAALFLGSSTEELIQIDAEIPLLISRDKKHEFGVWEAFKKLL